MSKIMVESDEYFKLKEKLNKLSDVNKSIKEKYTQLQKKSIVDAGFSIEKYNKLKTENESLKKDITFHKQETNKLEKDKKTLVYDITLFKNENEKLKTNIDELKKQNKELNSMIEEFENRKKTIAEQNRNKKEGISICLTAWQTQDYIEECLDSINSQTYFKNNDNYEILLGIDNDEVVLNKIQQIQHKYKNLKVFMAKENVGTYILSNTLMSSSNYSWCMRFDTDDVMPNFLIENLMKYKKDADIVRYSFKNFGIKNGGGLAYGSHIIRTEIFKKYGGYRDWRISGDYDLIYRLENIVKIVPLKEYFYYRRVRENSLEHSNETNLKSELRKKVNSFVVNESRKNITINCITTQCDIVYDSTPKIQFIIPNRGQSNIQYVIKNIKQYYKNYNYEIVVIEQCDNELFKKGQLYNIAIKLSDADYIALCDNDIIHFNTIKLFDEYYVEKQPYLGFTYISQVNIVNDSPVITSTSKNTTGSGAFLFGKKDDFIKINGYSNLYLGWGCEDNEISCRIRHDNNFYTPSIRHINNTIGHITHERRNQKDIWDRNKFILETRQNRNNIMDGINQTTYNVVDIKYIDCVKYIYIDNIGVTSDFDYKKQLKFTITK